MGEAGEVVRLVVAYLSPLPAYLPCSLSWHTTAPDAVMLGDEGWRVPVGRLGRTVGQGPRRCGLTVWARSKYIAPIEIQKKSSTSALDLQIEGFLLGKEEKVAYE